MYDFENKHLTMDFDLEKRNEAEKELLEVCNKYKKDEIDFDEFLEDGESDDFNIKLRELCYYINYIDYGLIYNEFEYYYTIDDEILLDDEARLKIINSIETLIKKYSKN